VYTIQPVHSEPNFASFSQSKKAITLSHNVIQLVKSKLIRVRHGTFISYAKYKNCLDQTSVSTPEGFSKLIDCDLTVSACAAYCIAAAMKMDNKQNFALIESAFEMSPSYYLNSYRQQEEMAKRLRLAGFARKFGEKWYDNLSLLDKSDERLIAICLNVIANQGEFDPTKNVPSHKDIKAILIKD
jgi:hypothetical protein